MKKLIIIVLFFSLFSCASDDEASISDEIIGSWQLIEQLLDPGDGSGVFVEIESDLTINFLSDGTYTSNGPICNMTTEAGEVSSGRFDIEKMLIITENCNNGQGTFTLQRPYRFDQGNLVVDLPCFEPCSQKFRRVR